MTGEKLDAPVPAAERALRDWMAGQALAGMLDRAYGIPVNVIAKRSYEMADAMLAAREVNQTETN